VDIRWLNQERPDRSDIDGAVAVLEAARAVDSPHQPIITVTDFEADLRHGWDGDPSLIALARDALDRVVGVLRYGSPVGQPAHGFRRRDRGSGRPPAGIGASCSSSERTASRRRPDLGCGRQLRHPAAHASPRQWG
jgi:hypothetical protein